MILFLGSSVTVGHSTGGVSFADMIAERWGCAIRKEAVSGTTLADGERSYLRRLRAVPVAPAPTLLVCQLSTNDAARGLPLGDVAPGFDCAGFDEGTTAGALESILAYARETWGCPVVVFTSPRFASAAYGEAVALTRRLAGKWGFTLCDLWHNDELNRLIAADPARFMADAIHPTLAGYEAMVPPMLDACRLALGGARP